MAARIRKTFKYDSDEDTTPWILDEEEQERVITEIRLQDEKLNEKFKRLLLAFPILCTLIYLPALVISPLLRVKLLCLLSITSLVSTAYILMYKPIPQPVPANRNQQTQQLESEPTARDQYLIYLNGVLSVLILLNSAALKEEKGVHDGFWLLCTLPALMFLVIMVGRRNLRGIDLTELENLKYEYKGA